VWRRYSTPDSPGPPSTVRRYTCKVSAHHSPLLRSIFSADFGVSSAGSLMKEIDVVPKLAFK
jgi:hypothetical protein